MRNRIIITALGCSFWLALIAAAAGLTSPARSQQPDDEHLTKLYLSLNDSPMQRKLRALRPFPVGVVYYQQRNHGIEEIRREFRTIKSLGFDSLKQILLRGGKLGDAERHASSIAGETLTYEQVQHAALDEGLYPWYYGLGGWTPITPELLKELKIPAGLSLADIEAHPAMLKHQQSLLRRRIDNAKHIPPFPTYAKKGEPGRGHPFLNDRMIPLFADWLRQAYGSVEKLKEAWNYDWIQGPEFNSFDEAARLLKASDQKVSREFRRYRDSMRFQADLAVGDYHRLMEHHLKHEPWEPVRTGGHQIFENQAFNGWDLEGQARAATKGGSFYSSIHLAWHFSPVKWEVDRPVYLQARIIADSFKGGWAATWESTGGPTSYSGNGAFTVDGGVMTRLMLSYIAAGLKGIGIWCWNSRDLGGEAGEYALTNLQGEPSDRARAAGAIARAVQRQRFELWEAMDEPAVGILYSWENEATFGRLSLSAGAINEDRDFRQHPSNARIGAARALMNANIPFEFVTERDLRAGLARRYPVIYLPHVIALPQDLQPILAEYVRGGGRLVADLPLLLYDDYGRKVDAGKGTLLEQVFGAVITDYHNTFNAPPLKLGDLEIHGQFGALSLTRAKAAAAFADGAPAIVDSSFGKGATALMNFEASRMAFKPGNAKVEAVIVETLLGDRVKPRWSADGALVYRRAAPRADHYFFINEGPARAVTLVTRDRAYASAEDVITREPVAVSGREIRVELPARSGRWLRCAKR